MRTFYIFKIKKHFAILTKNNPYNLYKTIERIYYLNENELKKTTNVFEYLKENINKEELNNIIYSNYHEKSNYTKFLNTHMIYDYFTNEKTKLIINKKYLVIRSTEEIPIFFKDIEKNEKNLFVCDFLNRDYFWLEKLV